MPCKLVKLFRNIKLEMMIAVVNRQVVTIMKDFDESLSFNILPTNNAIPEKASSSVKRLAT